MAAVTHESMPPLNSTTARRASPGSGRTAGGRVSDPTHVGGPDVLVDLELESDRKTIGEDPLDQEPRLQNSVHRRQKHAAPPGEIMTLDDLPGPFIIGPVGD